VSLMPGGRETSYSDVAIRPDGKILLAGYSVAAGGDTDMAITRLNANGTPDAEFGANGTVFLNVIATPLGRSDDVANALVLQPDGKIVVAGSSTNGSAIRLTVARLNPGGGLDPSFSPGGPDGDGIWQGPLGFANDVAVAADGKIVAAGTWTRSMQTDSRVERLNADGSPDTTFGTAGSYDFSFDLGGNDGVSRLSLLRDGKVLLAGYLTAADSESFVARVTPGTGLDPDFGVGGVRQFGFGAGSQDEAGDLAVDAAGKIDVAGTGSTATNFTLTRLTSAGALEPSLNGSNTVDADFGGADYASSIAVLANGKIVLAGSTDTAFAVARFQPGGLPDTSFGSGGKRTFDFPGPAGDALAMAVQPDGKLVLAGYVGASPSSGAVLRLLGDPKGGGGGPGGGGGGSGKVYRCGGKRATIVGTNGKDRLRGTKRADVIVGLGGNDKISSLGGNDVVCGGDGNDSISAGSGNDKVSGGKGNDKESGGPGKDKLAGDAGNDVISGGPGNDKESGGPGKDKLNGNGGRDSLNGGSGKDKCSGRDRKNSC
jgi:uncharacterized delta-60 repeat protein